MGGVDLKFEQKIIRFQGFMAGVGLGVTSSES